MSATATAAKTAAEIRKELEDAFVEHDMHGRSCTCCAPRQAPDLDADHDLSIALIREAYYAVDRYRPDDENLITDDQADAMAEVASLQAARAARQAIIEYVANAVGGAAPAAAEPSARLAKMVRSVLDEALAARGL